MANATTASTAFKAMFAATVLFGLSACGGEKEKVEYKTDVKDESGGELIVEDASTEGVDVNLPETPMTSVPSEEAPAGN